MMGRIGGLASREVLYPSLGSLRAVLARARYFCCINAIRLLSVHGSAEGELSKPVIVALGMQPRSMQNPPKV